MAGIQGGSGTANVANVTANNELLVALGRTASTVGYAAIVSENDTGTVTGAPYLKQPETDEDFRLRVSLDTLHDSETFNYAAQNTSKHRVDTTTQTVTYGSGFLTTNGSSITTINTGCRFSTYRYFPVFGAASTYIELNAAFNTTWAATNTTIDFGAFTAGTSTPYAPTDGVYFRANNTGLFGVVNYNGSEQTTSVFKASFGGANWTPTLDTVYHFVIVADERHVEFWIDDVLMAEVNVPVGNGQPFMAATLPLSVRSAIGGTAASAVMRFKLADYTVSTGGYGLVRPWAQTASVAGQTALQGQSGHTQGQTAQWANTALPTAAAATNTTAALGTGLSGLFQMSTLGTGATDLIVSSYQNPAPTTAITGRNLVITGISVDIVNTVVAVTGTPTTFAVGLAYGHTNVSLATTESAIAKAPRRTGLGVITFPVGAAPGAAGDKSIVRKFDTPIVVLPGEFVQVICKPIIATATATEVYVWVIGIDGYFE